MKHLFLVFVLAGFATVTNAQEQPSAAATTADKKNEAGIYGQTGFGSSNSNMEFSMFGAQYNRWVTPMLGFRIIAGFAHSSSSSSVATYSPHPDTVITRQRTYVYDMPVVGFGLVTQRHFYKKVHLYAAMELTAAYGNGRADTIINTTYGQGASSSSYTQRSSHTDNNASLLLINLSPSIGAKLQFRHLCAALELQPLQMTYRQEHINGSSYGIADFDLGNFTQRLVISYRF